MTQLTATYASLRVGAIAFATLFATGAFAQGTGACLDATSRISTDLRRIVGVMVSQPDSVSANERAKFSLPLMSDNQVTIVSDTAACRAASLAYDAAASVVPIAKPVVVLSLGTKRLVIKEYRFGEWLLAILFNQNYTTMITRFGL